MIGDDFIAYAGKIAALHGMDPAGARSCVSRAYYGIFHSASELLASRQIFIPKGENAHKKLVMYFANCKNADAARFASHVGDLHERRKHADYDLDRSRWETHAFAKESLERAIALQTAIKTLAAEPLCTAVMDGIRGYLAGTPSPKS